MVIETERLLIRTASGEEMVRLIQEQEDEALIKAYEEMLQGCLDHPKDWVWYAVWFIELKGGGRVGDLSFKGLDKDGSVEIGYGILKEHRGCGYAAEAVGAAVSWALEQPKVTRVEAETEPDNTASQRVLEKCGFIPAGTMGEEGPRFFKSKSRSLSGSEDNMTEDNAGKKTIARRGDWKTLPMPEEHEAFVLTRSFSEEEMDALRCGHIPEEMEDKWFWYMEGDTLWAHRSWTGYCIYQIDFSDDDDHVVTVNRDKDQYGCTSIEADAKSLNKLLDWWTETPYDHYTEWLSETAEALKAKQDNKED